MPSFIEVFYQPGKVFASLPQRRLAWVVPLILNMLLVLLTTMAVIHFAGMETLIRARLEGTRLTPEQMQTALTRAMRPSQIYISYATAAAGAATGLLVIAGLLMVFALMYSKQPRFNPLFSAVTLAYLPYWLITGLMTVLVLVLAPDRDALNFNNLLATNAGAFVNKDTVSRGLYSLLTSLDLLSFGEIFLLAHGFSKVNRTGFGAGLFAVLSLWILYVLSKMALSALF